MEFAWPASLFFCDSVHREGGECESFHAGFVSGFIEDTDASILQLCEAGIGTGAAIDQQTAVPCFAVVAAVSDRQSRALFCRIWIAQQQATVRQAQEACHACGIGNG